MYFNSSTYVQTIYKPTEQNADGGWGATSPPYDRSAAGSGHSTLELATMVGVGLYAGQQIYSGVTGNIQTLTGSSLLQEQIKGMTGLGLNIALAIKTKGLSVVFQGTNNGINYLVRDKQREIENEARAIERNMQGEMYTNGLGSAYYD